MNIKQAKNDIKNAIAAYLTKDEFGNYVIPIERQRPVFLMGAPGIGKTAIMEQIATELNIGLKSYSMTHHTRQSALGLPFITTKDYGGEKYSVSEYTMSEIIASVYDMIEETGKTEGILFLDEINCVSETLAPSMLQFLQYKVFGSHKVPNGWIVVTAGNPPEYNSSVREFDIVTWDRLKRIDVDPDYDVWREYALANRTHPAIVTYLDIKKDNFYKIETTVDGKSFVTARGWIDLSDMIRIYEGKEFPVNEGLILQYLQNKKIAKDFATYYDLFKKYRSDYQVDKILSGKASGEIVDRAKAAKFDERLSLLGLIVDALIQNVRETKLAQDTLAKSDNNTRSGLMECLQKIKYDFNIDKSFEDSVARQIGEKQKELKLGKKASNLSRDNEYVLNAVIAALDEMRRQLAEKDPKDSAEAFKVVKADYDTRQKALVKMATAARESLSNAFKFCEAAFNKDSQEMLILVTELTSNAYAAWFVGQYGCDEYFANNKGMMFYERKKDILTKIDKLDLNEE